MTCQNTGWNVGCATAITEVVVSNGAIILDQFSQGSPCFIPGGPLGYPDALGLTGKD
jgi:hypothetical protein